MNFLNLKAILSLNGSGFALGLKRAESQSKQFAREIKGEFARAFGAAAITAYAVKVVNLADNITDLADRLEISTQAIQEWSFAARKSGSSIEAVTRFLEHLALARERALGGDQKAVEGLAAFGITDLSQNADQMGRQVGRSIAGGNLDRTALREIGGKSANELIPALKSMDELSEAAHKAGQVLSDETLAALKQLKNEAMGLADAFTGPVAAAIIFVSRRIQDALSVFKIGIGSMAAFAGGWWGGGDGTNKASWSDFVKRIKDGWAAANAVMDDELAKREKRDKAVRDQAENRQAMASTPSRSSLLAQDKIHDFTPKKVAEAAARAQMERPQVNSWQQLGAAVRGVNHDHVRDIAGNTKEALKKQDEIRKAIDRFGAITGLNAAQED